MDYRIFYAQRALNDLADIVSRIAEDDDLAASRFGTALLDHVDLLGRFPLMGSRARKRPHVRKLVHSPIVVYYKIHEDKHLVELLHFRHGSRLSPRL